jgi:hypothetical protein
MIVMIMVMVTVTHTQTQTHTHTHTYPHASVVEQKRACADELCGNNTETNLSLW